MSKLNPNDFIKLNDIIKALSTAVKVLNPETHPEEVLQVTKALKDAQLVADAKMSGLHASAAHLKNSNGPPGFFPRSQASLELAEEAKQREYKRILDPTGKLDVKSPGPRF